MADEVLSALITGEEKLSDELRNVSGALEEVADSARDAAEATSGVAEAFDVAGRDAHDFADALDAVARSAGVAEASLEGVEDVTEEVRSATGSAAEFTDHYRDALSDLPSAAIEAVAANQAVAQSADHADEQLKDAAASAALYGATLSGLSAASVQAGTFSDLSGVEDVADALDSLDGSSVRVGTTPDFSGIEAIEEALDSLDGREVRAGTYPDTSGIRSVERALDNMSGASVRAGTYADKSGIEAIKNALGEMDGRSVRAGTYADKSGIKEIEEALDNLSGKSVRVGTWADKSGIEAIEETLDDLRGTAVRVGTIADRSGIKDIKRELALLSDDTVTIHTKGDLSGVETITGELDSIDDREIRVCPRIDRACFAAVREALDNLDDETVTVDVKLDRDRFDKTVSSIADEIDTIGETATIDTKADMSGLRRIERKIDDLDGSVVTIRTLAKMHGIERVQKSVDAIKRGSDIDLNTRARLHGVEQVQKSIDAIKRGSDIDLNTRAKLAGAERVHKTIDAIKRAADIDIDTNTDFDALRKIGAAMDGEEVAANFGDVSDASRSVTTTFDTETDTLLNAVTADSDILDALPAEFMRGVNVEAAEEVRDALYDLPKVRLDDSITDTEELTEAFVDAGKEIRQTTQAIGEFSESKPRDSKGELLDVSGMIAEAGSADELRKALRGSGGAADDLAESIAEMGDMSEDAFDSVIRNADDINDLGRGVGRTAQKMDTAALKTGGLGDAMRGLLDEVIAVNSGMDEVGDEFDQASRKADALTRSIMKLNGALAGTSIMSRTVDFGPINTTLKETLVLLPAAVSLLGALTAGLGSFAIGGLGAFAGVGGMLMGGLLGRGEEIAAADPTDDIETAWDGVRELFSRVGDAIQEALAPLKNNEDFQNLAIDTLQGVVHLVSDFVVYVNRLSGALMPVVDAMGDAFWQEEPRFFAELEKTVRATLPYLEAFGKWAIRAVVDAIVWFREEGTQLIGVIGEFTNALIDLTVSLSEAGIPIMQMLLPALGMLFDAITFGLDLFNSLPSAVKKGLIAFAGLAAVLGPVVTAGKALFDLVGLLGGGFAGLKALIGSSSVAIAGLTLPVSGLAIGVAALIGVIVTAIDHFKLWDDIIRVLIGAWNGFVEIMELVANAFYYVYDTMGPFLLLIPGIGQAIYATFWVYEHWEELLDGIVWIVNKLGEALGWLGRQAKKYLGPVWDMITGLDEETGISFDDIKIDQDPGGGEGPPAPGGAGGPPTPGEAGPAPGTQVPGTDYGPGGGSGTGRGGRGGQPPGAAGAQTTSGRSGRAGSGQAPYAQNSPEYSFDFSGSSIVNRSDLETLVERAVQRAIDQERRRNTAGN